MPAGAFKYMLSAFGASDYNSSIFLGEDIAISRLQYVISGLRYASAFLLALSRMLGFL